MRETSLRARSQRGVGLVETMVGLTLGLLVTLVITQVWGTYEARRQRTIGGASAQVAGLLAMTSLEQELRSAGAGLTDASFDCTQVYSYYVSGTTELSPVPAYADGFVPVRITAGGAAGDTLTIKRSGDFLGALPAILTQAMPSSSAELNVSFTTGFNEGDLVLAVDGTTGNCTVMLTTQVQSAPLKLQHNPGGTTTWNPATSYQNANGWPAYSSGAKIVKIGPLVSHAFAVNASRQLVLTDNSTPAAATTMVVGDSIVALRAQYGIAPAGSQAVNAWVDATAATGWNVLDAAKVRRIKAVRVAVVARSARKESADVTAPCKDGSGAVVNANGPCVWSDSEPVLNLGADPDWKRYRYRVLQTVIPLRNVLWANV